MYKRMVLVMAIATSSMLVAADCAKDCQDKFDECMKMSHSAGKDKICGEILHDCKMECAMGGN